MARACAATGGPACYGIVRRIKCSSFPIPTCERTDAMTDTLTAPPATQAAFRLEEATIDDLHAAIRSGETTCVDVVKHYLARIRAFNGVASLLVTEDGAPAAAATGTLRGGAPLVFPTETVKASTFIP